MLVTDSPGKAMLVEDLGLRFTTVTTELDRLSDQDSDWWALGKLVAYSVQETPFVHLDADVFLWKALPGRLKSAPVLAQHPEPYHVADESSGPRVIEDAFAREGLHLPAEWEWARALWGRHFRQANCGILGGTNVEFIRYYAQQALDLVLNSRHTPVWHGISDKDGLNQIMEQFVLAACLEFHRFDADSPFGDVHARYLFPSPRNAFDSSYATRLGFTHLLGDAKSNAHVADRLEARVRSEDEGLYSRCVGLAMEV
jgi:hypothetical protein